MSFESAPVRGVTVHYGTREINEKFGGSYGTKDAYKRAEWTFDYNDLPAGGDGGNLAQAIPAGATIVSAKMYIVTGFTSTSTTTDLTVGLETDAGVAIDADGLITAVEATQTAIATAGNEITGAGALVGVSVGADAGELVVAPTVNDLTAGKARVVVEYVEA